jgi:hypothetical protein
MSSDLTSNIMVHSQRTHSQREMEPTECSETSAFNIQTPGKYPEDNIPYPQHGESLKTTMSFVHNDHSHLTTCEDGTDRVFRKVGF